MASNATAALAAFGEPGDLTNPAQVALAWWSRLLGDQDPARALIYDPSAWGDYQWAVDHVAGRLLAFKVVAAIDAPDRIAYLRFVPEVAQPSQVFAPFLTAMTFVTLVKIADGSWRVWGLGPAVLSAREVLDNWGEAYAGPPQRSVGVCGAQARAPHDSRPLNPRGCEEDAG